MLMGYHSAVHEATDYTPTRLMLGRELWLPVDLATGRPPDANLPTVTSGYASALQDDMTEVHRQVRSCLKVTGLAMKQRYDQHMRDTSYVEGDKVWLYNPQRKKGLSPKLQSPWQGPYTILEPISSVTYKIRLGGGRAHVVHVDRLWRYHGPGCYSWGHGQGSDGSEDEDLEEEPGEDDWEECPHSDRLNESQLAEEVGDPLSAAEERRERPKKKRRPPCWMEDFCDVPEEGEDGL